MLDHPDNYLATSGELLHHTKIQQRTEKGSETAVERWSQNGQVAKEMSSEGS